MESNFHIVVGVDGSDGGRRALTWAVHEASARHGTVQAINAWRWDTAGEGPNDPASADEARAKAEQVLSEEILSLPTRSAVPVAAEAVEGRAAPALAAAARKADLLVLGSHGHSRPYHTVLGSVTEECVRLASCPVVVLPVPTGEPAPGRLTPAGPKVPSGR